MSTVTARMQVWNVIKYNGNDGAQSYEDITLHPVYSSDPNHPNYSFSQATPSGQVQMHISNPGAFGFFELHKEYDIEFKEHTK